VAEIKFCGLTRSEDARHAATLGAAYVGVIFAGGPRNLTAERASEVLAEVPASVRRVGVFADQSATEICEAVVRARLDVVQLHGATDAARIAGIRAVCNAEIWPVVRLSSADVPASALDLANAGDAVLLDALVAGALGGTGVTLPWGELAGGVDRLRASAKIVLAGGLRPENVSQAIAALSPDVVDVSSGVERSPGIKDHQRMQAFRDAVVQASQIPTKTS
jgi:phosphoribosylanthranilate isomerase